MVALGLADAVELRRILTETMNPTARGFEIRSRPQAEAGLSKNIALGKLQNQPVLIEYKSYDPNADATVLERTTYRVCQLIALLSRPQSPEAGPSLRILPCVGYYVEPAESRYYFTYKV